jgi:hypothetical protein
MSKKTILLLISFLFIALCGILLIPWVMAVDVSDIDGHALLIEPVSPGDMISVRYTHSVEKTPVNETYIVNTNGTLSLSYATFESSGAGLPSDGSYNITCDNGTFLITGFDRTFDRITYGTGNISRHTIFIHGHRYDMYEKLILSDDKKFIIRITDDSPINIFISQF